MEEGKVKARDRGTSIAAASEKTDDVSSDETREHFSHNERWEDAFQRLRVYRRRFGNCDVPFRFPEDTKLGRWVAFQRTMHRRMREGKTDNISLTQERIRRLEGIGFEWSLRKKRDTWEDRYNELVAFVKQFNHCQVPVGWEENPELAAWVVTQRQQAIRFQEGREAEISQEQITKLTEIGFIWDENTQLDRSNQVAAQRCSDIQQALFPVDEVLSNGAMPSAAVAPAPSAVDTILTSHGRPLNLYQYVSPLSTTQPLPLLHAQTRLPTIPGIRVSQSTGTLHSVNPYQSNLSVASLGNPIHSMMLRGAPAGAIGSFNHPFHSSPFEFTSQRNGLLLNTGTNHAQEFQVRHDDHMRLQGNFVTSPFAFGETVYAMPTTSPIANAAAQVRLNPSLAGVRPACFNPLPDCPVSGSERMTHDGFGSPSRSSSNDEDDNFDYGSSEESA